MGYNESRIALTKTQHIIHRPVRSFPYQEYTVEQIFEYFTRGYLEAIGGILTDEEIEQLPFSAVLMTLECGIRFLTDHLQGDQIPLRSDVPQADQLQEGDASLLDQGWGSGEGRVGGEWIPRTA